MIVRKTKDLIYDTEKKTTLFLQQDKIKKINFFLILFFSFVGIYILNSLHPLFGDDWMYSMMPEPSNEHVKSFSDILKVQYAHYFTWGGRSVVHIIAQSLLLMGEKWADFLNSLAYVALTLAIYKIANQSGETKPSLLLGINLLICFFQPAFGSTMLWITGSANYLWGTLIILCFLLPYVNHLNKPSNKDSFVRGAAFLLFGIIAGWTNENMGVALIVMTALFLYLSKKENNTVPRWALLGLIGVIIGCIMMLSAPGNFARYGASLAQTGTSGSAVVIFLKRFTGAIASFYYYTLALTFILTLAAILFHKFGINKKQQTPALIFFIGAIIATLAMSAAPIFPGRAAYGINTLVIVSIGILYANLDFKSSTIRRLSTSVLIFGLLFFSADYYRGYRELSEARVILDKRLIEVEVGKQKREKEFIFNDIVITPETKFFHYFELPSDSTDWHNRMFSRYYNIKSARNS